MITLTDWRGNAYTVGTKVLWASMSGRCVEVKEGTVVDIWTRYYCPDAYKWKRLPEGQELPREKKGQWVDGEWVKVETDKPVKNELRVQIKPSGLGSRKFQGWFIPDPKDMKVVTLMITENITVLVGEQ